MLLLMVRKMVGKMTRTWSLYYYYNYDYNHKDKKNYYNYNHKDDKRKYNASAFLMIREMINNLMIDSIEF